MDWETALPNSRYWVLYMLHQNFAPGDKIVSTTLSPDTKYDLTCYVIALLYLPSF